MAEVYATPDHVSPEPQEVSVDTLARKNLKARDIGHKGLMTGVTTFMRLWGPVAAVA